MGEGPFGRSDAEIDLLVRGKRSGIAVVGFGYIGTVLGAVLADRGWPVTGIDVKQTVVDEINLGKTTVPEPRLNELVANNVRVGKLCATTDFGVIVTVGTPLGPDFEPIADDIEAAARAVGEHLHKGHLVILKSTVPGLAVLRGATYRWGCGGTARRPAVRLTAGLRAVTHKLRCRNT
ncbi:MAG: dTDP-alpha-D-glucose dehydrogenase [Mycobacterium sp.]|jgi:UDP-N-acetyl-D-mannosaminuronate dehydrogenase|nr:dTDP-alpha-D-glucose dehydrogenase [Mycobacterium sp.]